MVAAMAMAITNVVQFSDALSRVHISRNHHRPPSAFTTFRGNQYTRGVQSRVLRRLVLVKAVATEEVKEAPKKRSSAQKRHLQSEKRRVINRSRKSEIRTRSKKVLFALETLVKKGESADKEELTQVEKLIGEAYSAIDRAVRGGTLHRNTGANRKSRLARAKKRVEISLGWYIPPPTTLRPHLSLLPHLTLLST